jgi:MFS family permease
MTNPGVQLDPTYKWIALSNTTLGSFMATLNTSIILIALPAIFNGIGVDPLAPGESNYFLWMLLGYLIVTATLLVSLGRISDIFGRVRLYNLGFAIFTLGSILLFLVPGSGNTGALELILLRLVQGVGAAFLFANSAAILTDTFPVEQRGMALGINQVASVSGSFAGLIVGGILAAIHWRAVFLVSVPFGLLGTIWAYLKLRETATVRASQRIDWVGNATFALGLTILLLSLTYSIEPYGGAPMGWGNPLVIGGLVLGLLLLAGFVWIELRVPEPMFRLDLFKIRMFSAGNLSSFLSSVARGGLQFMLVIWLQGIWLPLHGYSFQQTPLWSGIYMSPLLIGFIAMGLLSGWLSQRFGAHLFSTVGMIIQVVGFIGLSLLPANFSYAPFAVVLLVLGIGSGLFVAPNTTQIMNSVPEDARGAASGMRATFQNAATLVSIGVFFTIVVGGLAASLPQALYLGLTRNGVPADSANAIADLPPTSALFGAFLGYNPIGVLLPSAVQQQLSPADLGTLLSTSFFPNLIAGPFLDGLRAVFYVAAAMCAIGAAAMALRGARKPAAVPAPAVEPRPAARASEVRVVTISRQYGGGGGEIGARLARRLGWELLDRAVVQRVAEGLHLTEPEAEERDERTQPFIARLLASTRSLEPFILNDCPAGLMDVDVYRETVRGVIESAAKIGHVVIIGRGAMVVLAGRPDVLHVRVVAPLEERIAYVAYREGLAPAAAQQRLVTKDHDREGNLWATYGRRLDDEDLYDLTFNTGLLDLDTVVAEICLALRRTTPHDGRPAGFERYPGQPRDFQEVSNQTPTTNRS